MMAAAEAIVLRPERQIWAGGASNFLAVGESTAYVGTVADAEGRQENLVDFASPLIASEYEGFPIASILGSTFSDSEAHSMTESTTVERVAKLEAGMDTIRAEIRAGSAETREAVLSAVERLRADGEKVRADTIIQIHGFKVWVLAGVLGFLVTALLTIGGIFLRPATSPQIIQVPAYSQPLNPDGTREQPGAFNPHVPPANPASATSSHKR